MIDLHNHLLHGVDDGSTSIDESISMIMQMMESGYTGAVTTSHFDKGRFTVGADVVNSKLDELKFELDRREINFSLFPGNEIQIDDMTLNELNEGNIVSLNSSRYVLSELPMITMPHYASGVFYEMRLNRYVPIIAHSERYLYIQKDLNILINYIKSGCLVQMNLSSLRGSDSEIAIEMLSRNMVHFVATDSHSNTWRNADVREELAILKDTVGEEKFYEITTWNPQRVVDNEPISTRYENIIMLDKSNDSKKQKKWYQFWR